MSASDMYVCVWYPYVCFVCSLKLEAEGKIKNESMVQPRAETLCIFYLDRRPPLSAAGQSQLSEYAVPMMAARRVFQPLRPHKQTRPINEMEEREAVYAHRQGFTSSDGRERGKRPRKDSGF